jgi:hypothetical protein
VYAVGADKHVGGCYDTILKPSLDPVFVLPNFYTAMCEMYPLRRHGLSQHRVQLSAMKDVVGRPELGLDRLSKRRASERATILPPALVEERRPERRLGQLRAKPETDQQSRGIWSDINSGADLVQLPSC